MIFTHGMIHLLYILEGGCIIAEQADYHAICLTGDKDSLFDYVLLEKRYWCSDNGSRIITHVQPLNLDN